jgi:predicted TPR repeat methyltransferase
LNAHGRYSHARGYLEDVLAAAGYDQPHFADEILRNEGGRPVRGYVVSSRRPD